MSEAYNDGTICKVTADGHASYHNSYLKCDVIAIEDQINGIKEEEPEDQLIRTRVLRQSCSILALSTI